MKIAYAVAIATITATSAACTVEAPEEGAVGAEAESLITKERENPFDQPVRFGADEGWRAERPTTPSAPEEDLPTPGEVSAAAYLEALGACASAAVAPVETVVDEEEGADEGFLYFVYEDTCLTGRVEAMLRGGQPEEAAGNASAQLEGGFWLGAYDEWVFASGEYVFELQDTSEVELWLELRSEDGEELGTMQGKLYWEEGAFRAIDTTIEY